MMTEMPCATVEDRSYQVLLVETGPHAVTLPQGSVVQISTKTDLVHHHMATENQKKIQ